MYTNFFHFQIEAVLYIEGVAKSQAEVTFIIWTAHIIVTFKST